MGSSKAGNMSDNTSIKPSEPEQCSNGCGFFGTAATMGLCSKCYRDSRIQEEMKASAIAALGKLNLPKTTPDCGVGSTRAEEEEKYCEKAAVRNRCSSCNKKVGMLGFRCKCGCTFCGTHRYAEKHGCTFDYRGAGREVITKANPLIKKDKIENRI